MDAPIQDDDVVYVSFTDKGKECAASMYGFESWDEMQAWRAANPAGWERMTAAVLDLARQIGEACEEDAPMSPEDIAGAVGFAVGYRQALDDGA